MACVTTKKRPSVHDPDLCRQCAVGSCCCDGVELDLHEVARILRRDPDVPKPWFRYLSRDKRFPSGFRFTTTVRDRRCVFQTADRRCVIYDIRPRFCREFPMEGPRLAPQYPYLCHQAKMRRRALARRRARKRALVRRRARKRALARRRSLVGRRNARAASARRSL